MSGAARIMIMAGGTGGHVFPGLAVAEQLRAMGAEVSWLGTRDGLEARLVPKNGIPIDWISIGGVRGKGALALLLAPFRIALACIQAALILLRRRPQAVIGMGGFVSGPGGLVAWLMRRPLLLHEQNARAGTTNRILARFARVVFEAFPGAFPDGVKTIVSGNPVRGQLKALSRRDADERAGDRFHLLVIGGSLGARALNETVPEALSLLESAERPSVRHQAGSLTIAEARNRYQRLGIDVEPVAFIDDMAEAYAWADLLICRAGALTVSEVACVGVPAIFVPFPYAIDDHQSANARYLSDTEAAILVPQEEMTAERMADLIRVLMKDAPRRQAMADAAHERCAPDADRQIAEACLALAGGGVK